MNVRPDSFAEWLVGLKVGDEVVVKMMWTPGQPQHRAWVERKGAQNATVHWMIFDDAENGIGKRRAVFSIPSGGNTEVRLLHPTREVRYDPKLGYEFADRIDYFLSANMEGNPL